jgi:hypothetical protein
MWDVFQALLILARISGWPRPGSPPLMNFYAEIRRRAAYQLAAMVGQMDAERGCGEDRRRLQPGQRGQDALRREPAEPSERGADLPETVSVGQPAGDHWQPDQMRHHVVTADAAGKEHVGDTVHPGVEVAPRECIVRRLPGCSRGRNGLHDALERDGLVGAERQPNHGRKLRAAQLVLGGERNRVEIIREEYKEYHIGYLPVVLSSQVVAKLGEYERL